MQYYFAPMEGLTDSIYRRLHHEYFPKGVDRYFTPFFSPTVHRSLTPREVRELPPADSLKFEMVPQFLTKVPEDFLWMAQQCLDLGYREVNLNLGCPSGTVTAKGKGSGMLRDPEGLDRFLDCIFHDCPTEVSVKTRIGFSSPEEFAPLLEIYNRYPIKELTIHPRIRAAFYNGAVQMDVFSHAVRSSKNNLCFNGNLTTTTQIHCFSETFPQVSAVMIGRGLIGDPGMLCPGGTQRDTLEAFTSALLEEYLVAFGGSRNAMFRMKEHWHFLLRKFDNNEKLAKRLRKTTDLQEFKSITREIFATLPMHPQMQADW